MNLPRFAGPWMLFALLCRLGAAPPQAAEPAPAGPKVKLISAGAAPLAPLRYAYPALKAPESGWLSLVGWQDRLDQGRLAEAGERHGEAYQMAAALGAPEPPSFALVVTDAKRLVRPAASAEDAATARARSRNGVGAHLVLQMEPNGVEPQVDILHPHGVPPEDLPNLDGMLLFSMEQDLARPLPDRARITWTMELVVTLQEPEPPLRCQVVLEQTWSPEPPR